MSSPINSKKSTGPSYPPSHHRLITINGEQYRVTYQTKGPSGKWQDKTLPKNTQEIQHRLRNVFERAAPTIQKKLKAAAPKKNLIHIGFNSKHEFKEIVFAKRDGKGREKVESNYNAKNKPFDKKALTSAERSRTKLACSELSALNKSLRTKSSLPKSRLPENSFRPSNKPAKSARPPSKALISFYQGKPNTEKRTLQSILQWSDDKLEQTHNYIQWLFPTKNPSDYNPNAPTLNDDTIKTFKKDPHLKAKLLRSLDRLLQFYGLRREHTSNKIYRISHGTNSFKQRKKQWLTRPGGQPNHNFLRISRILSSLSLLGCEKQADAFLHILDDIRKKEGKGLIKQTDFTYWQQAHGSSKGSSLTPHQHEHRVRSAPKIPFKLLKELKYAEVAMKSEKDKAFVYQPKDTLHSAGKVLKSGKQQIGKYSIGFCHFQGRRAEMEDQHLAADFTITIGNKTYPVHLFGVFDGHDGNDAAKYLKTHFKAQFIKTLKKFNPNKLSEAGIWNALKLTFVKLNEAYTGSAGSTATLAVILDKRLWVANVGDSRTVIDNNGQPIQMSQDANPSIPRFAKSIHNRKGRIVLDTEDDIFRVGGIIAPARAFGDHEVLGMSSRPKITRIPLANLKKGSRLILACDGVWDVASTRQIVSASHQAKAKKLPLEKVARTLVQSAYKAKSQDNLTVLAVDIA